MARKRRKLTSPRKTRNRTGKIRKQKRTSAKTAARKKEIKLRNNFLPTLLVILLLWTAVFFIVYFIDPFDFGAIPVFFFILFLALLFSFSTLFANTRRGFLVASGLIIFLLLRYFGVGNFLNLILIVGLSLTIEVYFVKSHS